MFKLLIRWRDFSGQKAGCEIIYRKPIKAITNSREGEGCWVGRAGCGKTVLDVVSRHNYDKVRTTITLKVAFILDDPLKVKLSAVITLIG